MTNRNICRNIRFRHNITFTIVTAGHRKHEKKLNILIIIDAFKFHCAKNNTKSIVSLLSHHRISNFEKEVQAGHRSLVSKREIFEFRNFKEKEQMISETGAKTTTIFPQNL